MMRLSRKTNDAHNKTEEYYAPNIFYEDLNRVRQNILEEIIEIKKQK